MCRRWHHGPTVLRPVCRLSGDVRIRQLCPKWKIKTRDRGRGQVNQPKLHGDAIGPKPTGGAGQYLNYDGVIEDIPFRGQAFIGSTPGWWHRASATAAMTG